MTTDRSVLKRSLEAFASAGVRFCAAGLASCLVLAQIAAAEPAYLATPVGAPVVVFDPKRDACDGHDVPDAPLRAYRGADGVIHAFGLHYENRRMSGASLLALKVECPVVFRGAGNSDPKRFDDRAWITATWTPDGKTIHALAHHEFQANTHKGRCRFDDYMKCWWNSILNLRSEDSGRSFRRAEPLVAAATPLPSEHDQGRHRGFFNPSNIIRKDGAFYTLIGTTGWAGKPGQYTAQSAGVCLFRSDDLASGVWRAWNGKPGPQFTGPYSGAPPVEQSCTPLPPFPAPVGAVVRHRPSGKVLAIYQASAGASDGRSGQLAQSGFYLSSSSDLLTWSAPTLVLQTKSFYDSACGTDFVRNYPVLIDGGAESRNFEDIGDEALLFYSETRVSGCTLTSDRRLIARKLRISSYIRE